MKPHRPFPQTLPLQRGLSLVELMVSLGIGLFLLAGLVTLYANSSRTRQEMDRALQQVENGRYASGLLGEEIRHAGFYGVFDIDRSDQSLLPTALPDPCATDAATLRGALFYPIQGYDAPAISPLACLAAANHVSGTDIVVVRRVAADPLVAGNLPVAGMAYLQANNTDAEVQFGANPGAFAVGTLDAGNAVTAVGTTAAGATPAILKKLNLAGTPVANTIETLRVAADIRSLRTDIYFVSPCNRPAGGGSVCTGANDDGGRPIPTLKRMELSAVGGSAVFSVVALAEGVQNLQADYGVDTGANGAADLFTTSPVAAADWRNVVSVNLNILARANEASAGHVDDKTYSLGLAGAFGPFNDAFKRHVFSTTAALSNISWRRQ